jgi:hypothetical protein
MAVSKDRGLKSQAPRVSVTLPPDSHRTLEQIARAKIFSLAWALREEGKQHIRNRLPLLGQPGGA